MSLPPNPSVEQEVDFEKLYIFGAGGHGREIAWLARQRWAESVELVFLVDQERYVSGAVDGVPVRLLSDVDPTEQDRFVVALGDPALRRKIAAACETMGLSATSVIHPRAEVSGSVEIGSGAIICAATVLTVDIKLGQHVHINRTSSISHDVTIGDFTTVSPGVHVSGHVEIGEGVFIGTGANIVDGRPGNPILIANEAVIAAGACVTEPVAAGAMVAGVPALRKR
jgi:sugar O-acyltransferase (sialic acid O-acetyltransferase NeuD family)